MLSLEEVLFIGRVALTLPAEEVAGMEVFRRADGFVCYVAPAKGSKINITDSVELHKWLNGVQVDVLQQATAVAGR